MTDNPHLGEEYTLALEGLPQALREAYLMGNWNAFAGQVFSEWRDEPDHYGDGLDKLCIRDRRCTAPGRGSV